MSGPETLDAIRHAADMGAASVFLVATAWVVVAFMRSDRFR